MTRNEEQALDAMMRRVGIELTHHDEVLHNESEALLQWLAEDLLAGLSRDQRERDQVDAEEFAIRVRAAQLLRRAELRLPMLALRKRGATIVATASQGIDMARQEGCAAMLDLAAAAGDGRELWDEPCESWLELPTKMAKGRHVALRVAGDSMAPLLGGKDVILVRLEARPAVGEVVVAQLASGGYVVKRLNARTSRQVELASFNPQYAPVVARPGEVRFVGVVVARVASVT